MEGNVGLSLATKNTPALVLGPLSIPAPSPSQSLNSSSVTNTSEVCDTFTRIGADLTANTWRPVVARRCKGTDGVWRDR